MASTSLLLSPLPVLPGARNQGHYYSGKVDGVSTTNANESGNPPHDLIMEDVAEDDDNIVHILASLESHRFLINHVTSAATSGNYAVRQRNGERDGQNPAGYSSGSWSSDLSSLQDSSEVDEYDSHEDEHLDRRAKESKHRRWGVAPNPPSSTSVRSFACEKHSKWKKKCPANCPLRKEHARVPTTRRKLWTKKESALLVQWADDLVVAAREREGMDGIWEDIAKTLNRSVNSTKKKFMRLTNQWSRKPSNPSSSTASLRSRSTHSTSPGDDTLKLKRKRGTDEPWKDDEECDTDMEGESMQCTEVRNERRATVVCEKHRRWKKRCPADCKDKQEEAQGSIQTAAGGKRKTRHRAVGVVGRPAVSCRRHQLEHQKCPEDCPRRRTVDQYLLDRASRKEESDSSAPHSPASLPCSPSSPPHSPLHPSPSSVAPISSVSPLSSAVPRESKPGINLSNFNRKSGESPTTTTTAAAAATTTTLHTVSRNQPPTTHPSAETSSDFQVYHSLVWKSPAEHGSLGPDFHWYRPRASMTVSNPGIILDLQGSGLPHVSVDRTRDRRNSSSGFSESELETRRTAPHLPVHTLVAVPEPLFSLSTPPLSPTIPPLPPWAPSPSNNVPLGSSPMKRHTIMQFSTSPPTTSFSTTSHSPRLYY